MKFTLMRDKVVATKHGQFIEFKKGVPTFVPPQCWEDVQAAGAYPEEEIPEPEVPKDMAPADPAERSKVIQAALEAIATRNHREDFSAAGAPHSKVVSAQVGFPVSSKERDAEWLKFQNGKDD